MEELFSTFVRSIFSDNMIFTYYLGMCSFLAVSKNVKTALGLGIAVTFILTCTLPINYMLENYVLKEGALQWLGPEYAEVNLSFLALLIFIAIIAAFTQLVEMVVEKFSPSRRSRAENDTFLHIYLLSFFSSVSPQFFYLNLAAVLRQAVSSHTF